MSTTLGYSSSPALTRARLLKQLIDADIECLAYRSFIAGGLAACGAVTVTHPFETVKIRYEALCGRYVVLCRRDGTKKLCEA